MSAVIDEDLPDEIQAMIGEEQEATEDQIAKLTSILLSKRIESVAARKNSGIEEVWMICEEAYVGIDDANRADFKNAKWAKPTSMAGPVTTEYTKTSKNKSSAYVRLTSRYVDAATAKVAEILLPIDDKAFSIEAMPIPDLVEGSDDKRPVNGPDGQPLYRDRTTKELADDAAEMQQRLLTQSADAGTFAPHASINLAQPLFPPAQSPGQPSAGASAAGAAAAGAATAQPQPGQPSSAPGATPSPSAPPQVRMTVSDYAKMQIEAAEDAADKAETRIWDWMVDCDYAGETRKVLFDAARIGVGVLKGPVPVIDKAKALVKGKDGESVSLEIVEKVVPGCIWVDPWNFFPSDDCGENIHDGDGVFERDFLSPKVLKDLIKQKGYIKEAIESVLQNGPMTTGDIGSRPDDDKKTSKNRFEVWYWYGSLSIDDMAVLNSEAVSDLKPDQDDCYAIVTIVNDTIIRATLNPMDSGRFPYDVFQWSRRPQSWTGVGVAEQVAMPQRMVNAGTRALMNNAGISAGAQVIIDRLSLVPADGVWELTPNKIWYNVDGTPIKDAREVFALLEFPNIGPQLMDIINYAFKLAEEQSNIPLLAQGQIADKLPDTFGAAELLNTNANTLLRSIGYRYDNQITNPKVNAYYEWLLLDPEVPNDEKGDFKINAHGSVALIERAIQEQVFGALMQVCLNPAYRLDPSLVIEQFLKSRRIDPRKVQLSAQQQAKLDATPPAPPLPLQVAQLKAQSDQTIAQTKAQSDQALQQAKAQAELQADAQQAQSEQAALASGQSTPHMAQAMARVKVAEIQATSQANIEASRAQSEQAYAATEAQISRDNAEAQLQMLQVKRELAMLEYAAQQKISLDTLKTQLAKTAMMEQTKRQAQGADQQAESTENALDRGHDMTKHLTNLAADAAAATPPGAPTGNEQADVEGE